MKDKIIMLIQSIEDEEKLEVIYEVIVHLI